MGRSHYERIRIPEDRQGHISPEHAHAFQSKFCHDFQAAKGKTGAEIVRVGHDHSYEKDAVLCLAVSGTPSKRQEALLQRYSAPAHS